VKSLIIHTGPMGAAKTTAALHLARRLQRLKKTIKLIRPLRSLRSHEKPGLLVTKNGETFPSTDLDDPTKIETDTDYLWIDEPFLFDNEHKLFDIIQNIRKTTDIIVSGIPATSELKPFGHSMPLLMSVADEITFHKADCDHCHTTNSASRTVYCGPDKSSDIQVGGVESYGALCPLCWSILQEYPCNERKALLNDAPKP